jgi:hypothetical protein
MFIIGFSCLLSFLTFGEAIYSKKRKERRNNIAVQRMEKFIKESNNQKEMQKRLNSKEGMIDYLSKFRLKYDPDTHTYIKVEVLDPNDTDVLKV